MITLRRYQADDVQRIRDAFRTGARAPLYVLPTGGGKTRILANIAQSSEKRGKRVLILAHRVELIDQLYEALRECDVYPEVIAAGYNRSGGRVRSSNHAVAVASVQTLVRRLDSYAPPTLIICDEAHHCAGGNSWSQIIRAYSDARLLGVTATPCRLDGRGLGTHFDRLIVGPSPRELIDQGYLVRTRIFAPPTVDTSGLHIRMGDFKGDEAEALMDTPSITGNALQQYMKHAPNESALAFCTSVRHAENVADLFRRGGVSALSINGQTDKQVRRMAFADFKAGAIRVLTAADIFSEGVDAPGARAGIMLRPTQSLTLYRQQKGRILRPAPGKPYATLIDHVQNCTRPGFELLPEETDDWALEPDQVKRAKKPAPGIRVCPKCFAASPARASVCAECGAAFEIKARQEIEEREGELMELTPEQITRKRARREQGRSRSLADLEAFAKMKSYAPGWAAHVWAAREKNNGRRRHE